MHNRPCLFYNIIPISLKSRLNWEIAVMDKNRPTGGFIVWEPGMVLKPLLFQDGKWKFFLFIHQIQLYEFAVVKSDFLFFGQSVERKPLLVRGLPIRISFPFPGDAEKNKSNVLPVRVVGTVRIINNGKKGYILHPVAGFLKNFSLNRPLKRFAPVDEPARQSPLAAFDDLFGSFSEEYFVFAKNDRANDRVPQRSFVPIFKNTIDHICYFTKKPPGWRFFEFYLPAIWSNVGTGLTYNQNLLILR